MRVRVRPARLTHTYTQAWAVADRLGLIGPCCEQPEYNLFARANVEQQLQPLYIKHGLGLTTWSPLASGVLTGMRRAPHSIYVLYSAGSACTAATCCTRHIN